MRIWDIASWLGVAARMEPDFDDGVEVAASAIRFAQDTGRGGVGLLLGMVAVSATRPATSYLEHVLTQPSVLSPELLAKIDTLLPALIASQPTAASYLAGERLQAPLLLFLPAFEAEGWEPPGGWGSLAPEPNTLHALDKREYRRRAQAAVSLSVATLVMRDLASLCDDANWPVECLAAIRAYADDLGDTTPEHAAALVASIVGPQPPAIVDDLGSTVEPLGPKTYLEYVSRDAALRFRLGALHWLTRFRRLAKSASGCPSLSAAREIDVLDPHTGEPMVIDEEDGQWTVSPAKPIELHRQDSAVHAPRLSFRCPLPTPAR